MNPSDNPEHDENLELDPLDFSELEASTAKTSGRTTASKLSQDDPSLRVAPPPNRQLRKRAVVIAASIFAAIVGVSFVAAAGNRRVKTAKKDSQEEFGKPVIPQALLDAAKQHGVPTVPAALARAVEEPPPLPAVPSEHRGAATTRSSRPDGRNSAAARRDRELEEELKASAGDILVQTEPPPTIADEVEMPERNGSANELGAGNRSSAPSNPGAGDDPNLQERKNSFLNGAGVPEAGGYLRASVRHPRSPFELKPGTTIPAVLQTAINSDLPGPVIARVSENVCDSLNGQWLLIPQGSTLVAYYDSMVAWGQQRVLVCWKQLELPNGDSLDLGCMPAADPTGQAGLADEIDEHWWRIVKGAAISSLLSAATTAAAGNTEGYNPTIPQQFARGTASEIANAGQTITRRNIMIQPTITIRQGMPVHVIVTKTIDFTPDGEPTPCSALHP